MRLFIAKECFVFSFISMVAACLQVKNAWEQR